MPLTDIKVVNADVDIDAKTAKQCLMAVVAMCLQNGGSITLPSIKWIDANLPNEDIALKFMPNDDGTCTITLNDKSNQWPSAQS